MSATGTGVTNWTTADCATFTITGPGALSSTSAGVPHSTLGAMYFLIGAGSAQKNRCHDGLSRAYLLLPSHWYDVRTFFGPLLLHVGSVLHRSLDGLSLLMCGFLASQVFIFRNFVDLNLWLHIESLILRSLNGSLEGVSFWSGVNMNFALQRRCVGGVHLRTFVVFLWNLGYLGHGCL